MTRVLVIGAGHNGLVAAVQLLAAGVDVTVLEHAPRPGGASASVEVTLPGFIHDHCAAFAPMTVASPVMQELELDIDWVTPDVVMAHPFPDGTAIALHRSVPETARSAGPQWERAMAQLVPRGDRLVKAVLSPLPPVRPGLRLALGLRNTLPEWTRRMAGSIEALGLDVFDGDRRAAAWLAGSAQHSGLPPTAAASGAFGLLLQVVGHTHGWPFPRGGMQKLVDALLARAVQAEVRCSSSVEAIVVRNGRVAGVRLAGGEFVAGDAVVSTVSATVLARLLPEGSLPGRVHRRLRIWRSGTAPFKLDYALSGPVPWTAEEARSAGVVHVAGELHEFARAADDARRGEVPQRPALVVGQQSLFDPSRGEHTLYVYGHVPARYEESDVEVADRIEAQIERFAPGFRSLVRKRAMRSPIESERDNPSLVGGDLAGGSYEIDQQLIFRPAPSMCRYRTPLRGLYMAGASVHPGGAVHGMSGAGAARAFLRDRKLRRA